jgi:two-component system nitrogen regulation sensor histidine kinase NtrY
VKIENSSLQQKRWSDRLARHGKIWLNRKSLSNRIVSVLLILGAICGLLTYASLVNVPPFGRSSSGLIVMLNIDLVILLILLVLVSRRLIALYNKRKKGIVGSNLHVRLVSIFSLIAAVPAILMAVFSVGFFYFGLHGWLDDRVRTAIEESEAVADAYLNEHRQLIRADIMAMASDLNRQSDLLMDNPEAMEKMVKTQSFLRNFSDVYLFNSVGSIQAKSNPESQFNFLSIDFNDLENAKNNEIVLIGDTQNSIRAFLRLNQYSDLFVLADRAVDTKVLNHVEKTRQGVAQYEDLQKRSARLQILLTSIYILVTLLLTIAAVWFGLSFARRLMNPITALINASESVGKGDLTIRVDTQNAMDEFKMLGRAFNTMTEQIETQQQELIAANTQMDFRRRFTETILGGVSTGILSVDFEGRITLANARIIATSG